MHHRFGKSLTASIKASVIGASGYSGVELVAILSRHPNVRIDKLFANTSAGKNIADVIPRFGKTLNFVLEPYSPEAAHNSDIVFVALPSGEAMNIVPDLLQRGKRIVDLGGDFRLKDATKYLRYYNREHTSMSLLSSAIYGLPEWNAAHIKSAAIVANPGCYPTSAILPLAPLLREGIVKSSGLSISSLSGVTGAGRSSSVDMSFSEVNESVRAYKVGAHQHTPEIVQELERISGAQVALTFVPHLLPITRGIYSSIYAPLVAAVTMEEVFAVYQKFYRDKPFVRVSATAIPEIKNVNYTNYIDIGFRVDPDNNQLIVLSAIDNLVKGAAGQAVQNMNLMFGFDETEGLV